VVKETNPKSIWQKKAENDFAILPFSHLVILAIWCNASNKNVEILYKIHAANAKNKRNNK